MPFALDGKSYEIDLGTKNAAAFRKAVALYVEAARPIRNSRGVRVDCGAMASMRTVTSETGRRRSGRP